MKRILITGGAGFLGSHLCDRFIKEGYHVIAMDNLITGDLKNIEHLFKLPNFEFYHHDVSKFIHVPGQLDYILHFASPASPIDYLKIPIQTLKVGSLGIHNCLGLARVKGARVLIASTSEVYGDPTVHPQPEEYWGNVNPVGPRGVYDEAKRFQEAMTMAYHTYHGLETRIVRIFNTYGPRMRLNDGRVLPAFIGEALRGEDLTMFGDGSQTRAFCFVNDFNEAVFMRPGQSLTRVLAFLDKRVVDGAVSGVGAMTLRLAGDLRKTQTGYVRSYALLILLGTVAILTAILVVTL